ncbi:hypothetical protein IWZ03DRAFT_374584 [Phyllosticta citriasiana]|uniref:Uncharacterized protein n=2 Tax=Phyllosticta citriasiana TaxID=595635 RepID=A0ABR1KSC5_9PEZI
MYLYLLTTRGCRHVCPPPPTGLPSPDRPAPPPSAQPSSLVAGFHSSSLPLHPSAAVNQTASRSLLEVRASIYFLFVPSCVQPRVSSIPAVPIQTHAIITAAKTNQRRPEPAGEHPVAMQFHLLLSLFLNGLHMVGFFSFFLFFCSFFKLCTQ